jgi:branched-chain amino acid transport system substrate-binding protein
VNVNMGQRARLRHYLRGIGVVVAATTVLAACGSSDGGGGGDDADGGTIKVAIMDAETGALASYGRETIRGSKLALDRINKDGGVDIDGKSYKLDYSVTDLQSNPTVAAQEAQKAIQDGAQVILGPGVSALGQPVAQAVQRAKGKVIMISSATILDTYVGKSDPIFKSISPEDLAARQYIPVVKEQFSDVTSVAEIFSNDAVGKGIVDTWSGVWESNGYTVTGKQFFAPTETNFVPIMLKSSADTQGYFVGYQDAAVIGVIKAASEADRAKTFFTRGQCQPGLSAGDTIDNYACVLFADDPGAPSNDAAKDYYATYEQTYKTETDSYSSNSLYYYDYVQLLANAFSEAGSTDGADVAKALRGSSYEGVMKVGFDEKGLNTTSIKVGIVKNGKLTVLPPAETS